MQWFNGSNAETNITQLARGRKGGIPKRKRHRTATSVSSLVIPRQTISIHQGAQPSIHQGGKPLLSPAVHHLQLFAVRYT